MNGTKLISTTRVRELHQAALEAWEGHPGEREPGCVEAKVGNAITAGGYASDTDDPDILTVAVHLLVYFATSQCFFDGSKRAAWASLCEQLQLNGLDVDATTTQATELTLAVARREMNAADVMKWVSQRLIAWDPNTVTA